MDIAYWLQAIPLTMIFLIFYIVVIRPPRVVEAKRFAVVMAASVGDVVITVSGIYGRIIEVGTLEVPFLVEIAVGVNVRVAQEGIRSVLAAVNAAELEADAIRREDAIAAESELS